MKIQAINTNTSFKGLFTDKSAQNGGNWLMEYRPYSWESHNTGKMAHKERIDVFASKLPDNEEIFTHNGHHIESSADILGTESYYLSSSGIMRRTITEAPSMDREESLTVLDKKLHAFLKLKQKTRDELETTFAPIMEEAENKSTEYINASDEYDMSIFFGKDSAKRDMDESKRGIMLKFREMYANFIKYRKLMDSIDSVNEQKKSIQYEIKQIRDFREADKLIDISRRDIANPNEALVQALKDPVAAAKKIVCLPNGLTSMRTIFSKLGQNASAEDIIKFIENKMKIRSI